MGSWLYSEVLKDELRNPTFARRSTLNWMKSLRFEIESEHGSSAQEQFNSCLQHFKSAYPKRLSPLETNIFESLYSSLCSTLAIQTSENNADNESWMQPSSIVSWYYSIYFSVQSMLSITGQSVDDNHASIYRAYASNLSDQMPHPLNMKATHLKNEQYQPILPKYESANSFSLTKSFPEERNAAKGMLIEYLSGTAKYYSWLTKENILKKSRFENFMSKEAKQERDKKLQKKVGFMHCAFRYRGKANYRDAIYLTYGKTSPNETKDFLRDLKIVARFLFITALALAYRSPLKDDVMLFLEDIDNNLKGLEKISSEDRFWKVI